MQYNVRYIKACYTIMNKNSLIIIQQQIPSYKVSALSQGWAWRSTYTVLMKYLIGDIHIKTYIAIVHGYGKCTTSNLSAIAEYVTDGNFISNANTNI